MTFSKSHSQCIYFLLFLAGSAAAQVNIQIGQNFTGSTYGVNTSALPPDSNGTIGPHQFVEFINGEFAVYNKTNGNSIKRISDMKFWANAGLVLSTSDGVSDPRVIFDPLSQRWFATMVDLDANAPSGDPTLEANDFLLAVSLTADPTGAWKGFLFTSDPDNGFFADFPTLGVDNNAVYISGDYYQGQDSPMGAGLVSIPKADLVSGTPTIDNRTWFGVVDYSVRGQVYQPVMCLDGTSSGNVVATGNIGMDPVSYSNVFCFAVENSATTNATIGTPANLTVLPYTVPYNADFGVPQFTVTQPDGTSQLLGNDARFSARVYGVGGVLYAVHNTELNNHMAIRWYRISAVTHALLEMGTIADPNQDLFYPAIAANESGTVVIGYNACGLNDFVSCYAVAGTTVAGVTTFGGPITLQTGATSYHGDDELIAELEGSPAYSRWGDYNTLSMDPSDPTRFWAIIMFPSDGANNDVYSTQITELITFAPPTLTIASAGTNVTLSWPSSATNYQIQAAALVSATNWSTLSPTLVTNGGTISATISTIGNKNQYYRLIQTP